MLLVFAAAQDPASLVPVGAGLVGATAAMVATLRYIKRTEDSTVDNLVETVDRLEERCAKCERETEELRVDNRLLHRQVGWLLRRFSPAEIPDGFPDR